MLVAIRKIDGQTVTAYSERKSNGPFKCLECGDPVILRTGRNKISHFAHENPIQRHYAKNEGDLHRRCKMEIFEALRSLPHVRDAALERPLGANRPDVSAYIDGIPVAIEVQISDLSVETIMQRTIEYHRSGWYVLWLLQWTQKLDMPRYTPHIWERWIHAAYFGRVYYWNQGLEVVTYTFEPGVRSVPRKTWYTANGKQRTGGGYSRRLKHIRATVRGPTLNLATDFIPKRRYCWKGNGFSLPDARIFVDRNHRN